MSEKGQHGFTLIELMVVMVIIAVFAALVAPQIGEVSRRGKLTDLTNMVQQSAAQVRTYALQTRRASVLEVSDGRVWVNVLEGSDCWSGLRLENRCMHNYGKQATQDQDNRFDMSIAEYTDAGAYLCNVDLAHMASGTCQLNTDIAPGTSFALCYSGDGELFYRAGADATTCSGPDVDYASDDPGHSGGSLAGRDSWKRACTIKGGDRDGFSGALLYFNRFESPPSACESDDVLDVLRGVHVPQGGAPYSRVET